MILSVNIPEPIIIKGIGHTFGEMAALDLETIELGKKYRVTLKTEAKKPIQLKGRVLLSLEHAPLKRLSLPGFIEVRDK